MKSKLCIAIAVLTLTVGCAKKKEYHCLAMANEQCASQEWYTELQDLKALNNKYAPPADVQQRMKEKLALLQASAPQGYDWNEQFEVFVKHGMQPTQLVPPPPLFAPAPTAAPDQSVSHPGK